MDNQKQPILPSEDEFNDCDKAQDVLTSLKKLLELYGTFEIEAGSETLHQELCGLKKEVSSKQRLLFDLLYSKGWYPVAEEDKTKLANTLSTLKSQASQLK